MKFRLLLCSTSIIATTLASAQAPAGGQKIGLALQMQRQYATVKQNLTEAADKFADADYAYRPSPDIRPYGSEFGTLPTITTTSAPRSRVSRIPIRATIWRRRPPKRSS